MRKGREGLAQIVREVMERNPLCYDEAFIFYSKDYKKVKILHYDLNGYVMYEKWFDDGRFFREYIEDILTRLMKGEKADASFLPNKNLF